MSSSGEPNGNNSRKIQVDDRRDSEMSVDKPDSGGTMMPTTTSSSEATPPMLPYSKDRERITKSDDFLGKVNFF